MQPHQARFPRLHWERRLLHCESALGLAKFADCRGDVLPLQLRCQEGCGLAWRRYARLRVVVEPNTIFYECFMQIAPLNRAEHNPSPILAFCIDAGAHGSFWSGPTSDVQPIHIFESHRNYDSSYRQASVILLNLTSESIYTVLTAACVSSSKMSTTVCLNFLAGTFCINSLSSSAALLSLVSGNRKYAQMVHRRQLPAQKNPARPLPGTSAPRSRHEPTVPVGSVDLIIDQYNHEDSSDEEDRSSKYYSLGTQPS